MDHPIDQFSPEKYVTLWLRSHQTADNKRNTERPNDKREITKKGSWNFFVILLNSLNYSLN